MRICFITQAVDESDPMRANVVNWLRVLANKPRVERLNVIARLPIGTHDLPRDVSLRSFVRSFRITTLLSFYHAVWNAWKDGCRIFFIHQGGAYPVLLTPFRYLLGARVVQWKAHPVVDCNTRIGIRWANELIFTCSKNSFPVNTPKRRIVGHGIDLNRFPLSNVPIRRDLVTTGRITERKKLHRMIQLIAILRDDYNRKVTLDIYGAPSTIHDQPYLESLIALIETLALTKQIALHPPHPHEILARILGEHRVYLNLSRTALDKAVLEAMAVGVPVVSNNNNVAEILPSILREQITVIESADDETIAERVLALLDLNDKARRSIGGELRDIVAREHSVDVMFDRILSALEKSER